MQPQQRPAIKNHYQKLISNYLPADLWAALVIVAGGVALRIYGLDFGLPYIYNGDEPDIVGRGLTILLTGDLNPHFFGHPGTVLIYLCALIYGGLALDGQLAFTDLFYFARFAVVTFAAGSIFLTYLIGKRLMSYRSGLLAAALLAVVPLHADFSRLARTDVPMTFFVLASTWFVISIGEAGRWRDYLVAGFLLGLGVATKYPALLLALVIIWAHILQQLKFQRPVWANLPRPISAGASTLLGAFAGSPYLFIDFKSAWTDITFEARSSHLSATSDGFFSALTWYLSNPLLASIGILGGLMVIAGAWSVIRRRTSANSIILVFPVCFMIFISFLLLRWDRWVIPVIPYLCLLAAFGLEETIDAFRKIVADNARVPLRICAWIFALAMLVQPLLYALPTATALANTDTRTLAHDWILKNVPPDSALLAESNTPQLPKGRYRYFWAQYKILPNDDQYENFPISLPNTLPIGAVGTLTDLDTINQMRIDYIVLSNLYDRLHSETFHNGQAAVFGETHRQVLTYEAIMERHELVFEALPEYGKVTGNHVRIYRVKSNDTETG
jgi:hypothetical protein